MTAKESSSRRLMHTRNITCKAYERDDGLWDIEAQLVDLREEPMPVIRGGWVPAGQPLHDMRINMTVDMDMKILDIDARTAASPTPACGQVDAAYKALIGETIGAGFKSKIRATVGGFKGCTHLTELLQPVATTVFQALWLRIAAKRWGKDASEAAGKEFGAELIDSCSAYQRDGQVFGVLWQKYLQRFQSGDVSAPSEGTNG